MDNLSRSPVTKSCVVVIPIHSPLPSYYELISFKQCFDVLHNHPIYVLCPAGMDLRQYTRMVPDFKVISISKKWLSSRLNYNKLKLSQFFYKFFDNYTFMLTYELDAFIFKDEIEEWCTKGYDYIGAPWFENNKAGRILGVGNSGFSLRRISSIKEGIKHLNLVGPSRFHGVKKYPYIQKYKSYILKAIGVISYLRSMFQEENSSVQNAEFMIEEDTIIANQMPAIVKNFKVAPVSESYKFSFEVEPEVLFKMNHYSLPTGCHAWWRYNLGFWKPYIESYGYKL